MSKSTDFVYDRKTGRWRKNGKWASAPDISQLRTDKLGRPLDSTGKRIPAAALQSKAAKKPTKKKPTKKKAAPKKKKAAPKPKKRLPAPKPAKPKPKRLPKPELKRLPAPKPAKPAKKPRKRAPKPPPRIPIKRLSKERKEEIAQLPVAEPSSALSLVRVKPKKRRKPRRVVTSDNLTERAFISSSFENAKEPDTAGDVLYNVIRVMAGKTHLEPDDIILYQYGVHYVNTTKSGRLEETAQLVNFLTKKYPEFSFAYDEDAVFVAMGDPNTPILREEATAALKWVKDKLVDIWHYLTDLWDGDIGWFAWADNDEIEGDTNK